MKKTTNLSRSLPHAVWQWLDTHHPEHTDNFNLVTIRDMDRLYGLADMHKAGKLPTDAETIRKTLLAPTRGKELGHLEDGYLELVDIGDRHSMTRITITKHGIAFTEAVKAAIAWYIQQRREQQQSDTPAK